MTTRCCATSRERTRWASTAPWDGRTFFVEFLCAHRDHVVTVPDAVSSTDWRRPLAYRRTDEHVRASLQIIPLSVASDRIGVTAMRAARLQALLARHGYPIDRAGTELIVEVYPAAGLKPWSLPRSRYKGQAGRALLNTLVDQLQDTAPWLELGDAEQVCRDRDHALDAMVTALPARAAALGLTDPTPSGGPRSSPHRRLNRPSHLHPQRTRCITERTTLPQRGMCGYS